MKSDIEDKKWLDEYPALKQIPAKELLTIPEGYFSDLESRINAAIKLEELRSGRGFTVPQNYFDELSSNIQSRINIDEFVNKEAPGLTVPANYFDELSSNIQSRINIDGFVNKEAPGLTIPANYFDELNSNIQSRVNIEVYVNNDQPGHALPVNYFEDMEQQISARIAVDETLSEQENFTVPAGYFNTLNKQILNKTVNQEMVKRKGVVVRMLTASAFKYAAAACFVLAIGTTILVNELTAPAIKPANAVLHKQLSTLSTSDIQSYLQDDVDANETQHTVIDDNTPVNIKGLSNALQQDEANTNN